MLAFIKILCAHDFLFRIRGALGSMLIMNENIGVVLAFTLGNYFSFRVTPIFVMLLAVFFTVTFSFFPESPSYLMKCNEESVSNNDHDSRN